MLPRQDTAKFEVLETLFDHGALSIEQATIRHGRMGKTDEALRRMYEQLEDAELLRRVGQRYRLTERASDYVIRVRGLPPVIPVPVVAPPYRPPFRELQPEHYMNPTRSRTLVERERRHFIYANHSPKQTRGGVA